MAKLELSGLDDVFNELEMAGEQVGEIADEMLKAGGEECVKAWREAISQAGHDGEGKSGRGTGEMAKSVGVKLTKKNGMRCAEIYPLGKDSHGVRNAEKAFILHYGRSNMKGDHFVDNAERIAEQNAVPVMQEIWENAK